MPVAALLLAIVLFWIAWRFGSSPSVPERAAAPPHEASSLDLETAHARAVERVEQGRWNASLPYFRRQIELLSPPAWALHVDYASALHNAAVESRGDAPVTRSSPERVALVIESLRQTSLAEANVTAGEQRSRVLEDRAHTLGFWGFAWDALVVLDSARAVPGAPARVARKYEALEKVMAHPTDARLPALGR